MTRPNGDSVTNASVTATHADALGGDYAATAADGSFTIRTRRTGPYVLEVSLDESCRLYHQNGGVVMREDAASQIMVNDGHVDDIAIIVPDGICEHQIHGMAVDHANVPLSGSQIRAYGPTGIESYSTIRDDGSFSVTIPESGSYRLGVWLDGECHVYHHADAAVGTFDTASLIQVADRDVTGVNVVVAEQRCGWTIRGVMLRDDGTPVPTKPHIRAETTDTTMYWFGPVDDSSAFEIEVPTDGSYRLRIWAGGQCEVFYRSDEVTSDYDLAELVEVDGSDVMELRIVIPGRACGWHVIGRVVDGEGRPVGHSVHVVVDGDTEFGGQIDDDGVFNFPVPTEKPWVLEVLLDGGCFMYYRAGGDAVTTQDAASLLTIAAGDLTGIEVAIPSGACDRQIRGRVVTADGQGVADAWLWARTAQGGRGETHTDVDGTFVITVPVSDAYALAFYAPGDCWVWYVEAAEASAQYATYVVVADTDVTDLLFQLPDKPCG